MSRYLPWLAPARRLVLASATAATLLTPSTGTVHAAPGDLDPAFGTGGQVTLDFGTGQLARAAAVIVQSDQKVVVAGTSGALTSTPDFALARLNPNGTLDASFGLGGKVTTDFGNADVASALVQQPDGNLVAAGFAGGFCCAAQFALARYKPDGSLDSTFGAGGKVVTQPGLTLSPTIVRALVVQPDLKIVAGGIGRDGATLARYNPNGSLDAAFGNGGLSTGGADAQVRELALQADGKLVALGDGAGGPGPVVLARTNSDGSLDTTFGTGGRVITDFHLGDTVGGGLVIQSSGKLVAGGDILTPAAQPALRRYNPDGSLDTTFGVGGLSTIAVSGSLSSLVAQTDGKLLAAGTIGGQFGLARLTADGALDPSFGVGGILVTTSFGPAAAGLALQSEKIVTAGPGWLVARFLGDPLVCVVNTLAGQAASLAASSPMQTSMAPWLRFRPVARLDPLPFRRLRDELLVNSEVGRRYVALYNRHSPEIVRLLLADPDLRTAILDGLVLWQPVVQALVDGRGDTVHVTSGHVSTVNRVLDRLTQVGSPSLRTAIETERNVTPVAQLTGKSLNQALTHLTQREVQ